MSTLEAYRERLRSDPVFFLEELWRLEGLDRFEKFSDIDRDAIRWAAFGDGTEATRQRGVLGPRTWGKTYKFGAGLTAWVLYRNPTDEIVGILSKSAGVANATTDMVRAWIDRVPFLQHLRPDPAKKHRDSSSKGYFDVGPKKKDRNPSVMAKGVESTLPSMRASWFVADDIETYENTKTSDSRDDLKRRADEILSITTYGNRDVIYIGTFHHEESVYLKLADEGVVFRTYPLIAPHPHDRIVNLAPIVQQKIDAGELRPSSAPSVFDGDCVFPHRFDDTYIAERKAKGKTYFAMQHVLIADLGDTLRYPLQLRDLIVFDQVHRDRAPLSIIWGTNNGQGSTTRLNIPHMGFTGDALYGPVMFSADDWSEYRGTKMWIDPAGAGSDRTAYAIISHLAGNLWLKAAGGLEGGYSIPTLTRLVEIAREHGATEIYVEEVGLSGSIAMLLEPIVADLSFEPGDDDRYPAGWKCTVTPEPKWARGQKEIRIIQSLEPVLNTHRLVVPLDVIKIQGEQQRAYELQYQLTRITRQRGALTHDDVVEAIAACVWKWQDILALNPETAADREKDRILERVKRDRLKRRGLKPREPQWIPPV